MSNSYRRIKEWARGERPFSYKRLLSRLLFYLRSQGIKPVFGEKEIKRAVKCLKISPELQGNRLRKVIEDRLNHLSDEEFISVLYYIVHYREPDPEGYHSYVSSVKSGTSRMKIISDFLSSEEYKSKKDNVALVDEDILDWHLPVRGHERELIGIFKKRKGNSVFVDVGAHVGTWSLHLSPFYGKVIAFEPNPAAYNSLVRNVESNQLNNVITENIALWNNQTGTLRLRLYNIPGCSTLLEKHPLEDVSSNKTGEIEVRATSLDYYLRSHNERIGLIKVDVEGAEVEVVEGAINTIRLDKPALVIEVHTEKNMRQIKELLGCAGIEPYEYKWFEQKHLIYLHGKYDAHRKE